jgi:hypothetical protein
VGFRGIAVIVSPLLLAYLHLKRNPVSTIIALVAIAASVACGGVLLRLYELAGDRFSTLVAGPEAVIGAKASGIEILLGSLNAEGTYPATIPGALYRTLKEGRVLRMEDGTAYNPSAIRLPVPLLQIGLLGDRRVIATDENFFRQESVPSAPKLLRGGWFGPYGEAVVGLGVSEERGINVGDTVDVESWTGRESAPSGEHFHLRVVGVFAAGHSAWNGCLFTSLAEAQRVHAADHLHYILLYLDESRYDRVAELVNTRTVAELISVREEKEKLANIAGIGVRFGMSITILVILLGGLAVSAVMTTRFEGMTTELAVFQALGFTFREIGAWLMLEGLLLALPACLAGALVENALFPPLRALMGSALPPSAIVSSPFTASAPVWGVTILVTVLAVAVPYLRLLRQDAPATLRGV